VGQPLAFCDRIENVGGSIYCDQTADHVVLSSPSWHDNVLSAGKDGGVRSPLSVIGRSSSGRRLIRGELAAKKAAIHGSDIASAKKAVAELIAVVQMDNSGENFSHQIQKQVSSNYLNRGTSIEQEMFAEQRDDDAENKENIFYGLSMDEIVELSDSCDAEVVGDAVDQLDRQARTLRRRSQLSTNSFEYESILQQLGIVRQRQAELEKLQVRLHSRLLHCQPTSFDEQPLNLKISSEVEQDMVEPLDLRITSVKQCEDAAYENTERVALADITSKVVGNADPNDCFEVPDSPAAETDTGNTSPVKDAVEVDGVVPVCENLAGDHESALSVPTERDFVESSDMKSTPVRSSPADCGSSDGSKVHVAGVLDQYLASLNVSDISEADAPSPSTANLASPDTSSEFGNYQIYQRLLDASGRCLDPIAAVLLDGDEQVCCLLYH